MDVPIYRCPKEKFNDRYDNDLKKHYEMIWPQGLKDISKNILENVEQSFWERYGTPWQFNQIVGWLRLFTTGAQIRGDLWELRGKRFVRNPKHKQYYLRGKAFELTCYASQTSKEILDCLKAELKAQNETIRGGKLVVDLEVFDNLSNHIDWHSLVFNREGDA